MNKFLFYNLLFACLLIFPALAKAQTRLAMEQDTDTQQTDQPVKRPNLLRELNLTPDQIQQMRRINQERKNTQPAAKERLKAANEALDQAMYADADNEAEVQARQREVNQAQLEVLKNRVNYERSVRRILTAQQLSRFRELRQQYKPNSVQNRASQNRTNANPGNMLNRNPNGNLTARQQLRLRRMANQQRRLTQ